MRKQKNSIVATEISEVNAEIATLAPANEVTAKAEETKAEKAVKVPALTNEEKKQIKAATATQIIASCDLPATICVNFLQEGFTLFPANEAGTIAKKRAICGVDKLSVKGGNVQFFFYKNVLSVAALTEIFAVRDEKGNVISCEIPATQRFGTGGNNYNPFIRCEASKIPALVAASLATAFTATLLEEVANEAKKATEKAAKATAKIEPATVEGNEKV